MSTRARARTTPQPIERELQRLRREVSLLRGGLISVLGEDPEGEYRPEFIVELLGAAEETPTYRFTNSQGFLRALRSSRAA